MKVLVIGSGPAVEGQVSALAVKALQEHGHEVVLLDPSPVSAASAQRTYLEPLTAAAAQRIIAAETPDALLAGIGRAATELALELLPSLGSVKWLGPAPQLLSKPAATGDTVVEVAGDVALGQIQVKGETWVFPAPLHRPELDEAAVKAVKAAGFTGCARVFFASGQLTGLDPVVGAASAFTSRVLGVSIPRLAVRLALGLNVDERPVRVAAAVRTAVAGVEVMTLSNGQAASAPGKSVVVLEAGLERGIEAEGLVPVVVDANPANLSGKAARYYEPPQLEAVLAICQKEQPKGVIVQLGGRAALELAPKLEANGITVLGTSGADVARALDRAEFARVVKAAGLQQPKHGVAATWEQAEALATDIGYPLLARGAHGLDFVADATVLKGAFKPGMLLEGFISEATQACVELVRDRTGKVVIGGVVENVEPAGVHAADAACTLPPHSLKPEVVEKLKDEATALANALNIVGLLDVQFALQGKAVWVLEANPRAGRTLPFVAKATGVDLPALAVRVMLGRTLEELGLTEDPVVGHCAVREAVFDENVQLGPQMRSTGAVMAVAETLPVAFGKSQLAAGTALPSTGTVFISVPDHDKPGVVDVANRLIALGFSVVSTKGTQAYLQRKGLTAGLVKKVRDGSPHVADAVRAKEISMVVCAVSPEDFDDGQLIRQAARQAAVPNFTTVEAARMAVSALEAMAAVSRNVVPLEAFARR
ncbi:MAG: ATP-grasp domain-containing protein [Myxococcaceae bacterium]|nr:ATP-grasp domain-containing protein [Myxococcaceae bacterium]